MSKNLIKILTDKLDTGELLEIVDQVLAGTQVLAKLGFSNKGQYVIIVRNFLLDNDIDISHWTSNGKPKAVLIEGTCPVCNSTFFKNKGQETTTCGYSCANKLFRAGTDHPNWKDNSSRSYRKKALDFYGYKCGRCGYNTNSAAIVVHHIDRNRVNNNLENLEVLCCNCHAIEHYR